MEDPPANFNRLAPGREVRLRYGYIIRCESVVRDAVGQVVELRCTYDPASRGGTAADGRKVRGTIHWVAAEPSITAEIRLYDRLFADEQPDEGKEGADYKTCLNPQSLQILKASRVEPSLVNARPGDRFQFERLGYFYVEPETSAPGRPVFNRIVTLRDTWAKLTASPEGELPAEGRRSQRKNAAMEPVVVHDPLAGLSADDLANLRRLTASYGIADADARILIDDPPLGEFFEAAVREHANPPGVANWVVNDLRRELKGWDSKEQALDQLRLTPADLGALVTLIDDGTVTGRAAKTVFEGLLAGEGRPAEIVAARGLRQLDDAAELEHLVDGVLAGEAENVALYRDGKTALFGFFVGQVMKASRGRADPASVGRLLRQRLEG
jgi:glutaminyl-tRNA synthetase